jgi:hypothetical protein
MLLLEAAVVRSDCRTKPDPSGQRIQPFYFPPISFLAGPLTKPPLFIFGLGALRTFI